MNLTFLHVRRHLVVRSIGVLLLELMELYFLSKTSSSFLSFLTWFFRFGFPRLASGTAITSVRISMSVFGYVPTRDEPAECLPWTVERVYVERIHCPDTEQLAASVGGLGRTSDDFCLIFGILSWLMPIRDRSGPSWLNASTWSERPKYF